MAQRGEKAPDGMEQACVLCRRAEADPTICGRTFKKLGLCAHEFCLRFADNLCQQEDWDVGLLGFLPEDIRRAVDRAARKDCCVCGGGGATITCQEVDCPRSFHLPCSLKGRCVTQFYFSFRSFCSEHSPRQSLNAAPEAGSRCLICLDAVEGRDFYNTVGCPACKHAWFHRECIQVQAMWDGMFHFRCPHCRDRDSFYPEMWKVGIRVPFRGASRDTSARQLVSPAASSGPPAPQGSAPSSPTGPRRVRGRGRVERQATTPYHRPLRRRHAESGTPGQAVPELSHHSPAPDTSTTSTTSLPPSGESDSSAARQSSSHDGTPGPVRRRGGSRSGCRAQNPYSQRGRRRRS